MVTLLILLPVLFLCQIVQDEACRSRGHTVYVHSHTTVWQTYGKKKKKKDEEPREHWDVPEDMKSDYGKWVSEYMENVTRLKEAEEAAAEADGNGGGGFYLHPDIPTSWQGYGTGNGGQDPPPWAIVPYGYGKPELCFLEPARGHCGNNMTRWGYNSYHAQCFNFWYSGCGGNGNNFKTKIRCEEACLHEIQSNCQKYGEYMEYQN